MAYRYQDMLDVFHERHPDRKLSDEEIITYIQGKNPGIEIIPPDLSTGEKTAALIRQTGKGLPAQALPQIAQHPGQALAQAGEVGLRTAVAGGALAGQVAGQIALPRVSGLTTTPLTEYIAQRAVKEGHQKAWSAAKLAGGTDLAISAVGTGLNKIVPSVLKGIGKGISRYGLGVPKEDYERVAKALEKKEPILNGSFNFNEKLEKHAIKAEEGLKGLLKDSGEKVRKYKTKINKLSDVEINTSGVVNEIDDLLKTHVRAKEPGHLGEGGIRKLNILRSKLRGRAYKAPYSPNLEPIKENRVSLDALQKIKETAQDMVAGKFYIRNAPVPTTTVEDTVMKGVSKSIRELIGENIPSSFKEGFLNANKEFSEVASLNKVLGKDLQSQQGKQILKGFQVGRSGAPQTFYKTRDAIEELDTLLPKKKKFLSETLDTLARSHFEEEKPIASMGALKALTTIPFHPKLIKAYLKHVSTKGKINPEPGCREMRGSRKRRLCPHRWVPVMPCSSPAWLTWKRYNPAFTLPWKRRRTAGCRSGR